MSNVSNDMKDHHIAVAERIVDDIDWAFFDQSYDQHLDDQDPQARANLLDAMQAVFLDEMVHRCVGLRVQKEAGHGS